MHRLRGLGFRSSECDLLFTDFLQFGVHEWIHDWNHQTGNIAASAAAT
jgi:predicted metalloprotease with PDZ domain